MAVPEERARLAAPADAIRPFTGVDARRSTRIDRAVPLIIAGQNRLGQLFQERTCALNFNLHGCRLSSRHDSRLGTWISLQVAEVGGGAKTPPVRAQVRSIHAPASPREPYRIGVELEIPANVWGISSPPEDWLQSSGTTTTMASAAAGVAVADEPLADPILTLMEPSQPKPPQAPPVPAPALAADQPQTEEEAAPAGPRVVITSEQLVQALQGKLQQAVEKAAPAAVTAHWDETVSKALAKVEAAQRTMVEQIEQLASQRLEAISRAAGEADFRLLELRSRAEEELDLYKERAREMTARLEKLAAEVRRDLAESRNLAEKLAHEMEPQIRARLDESVGRFAEEFQTAALRMSDRQMVRLTEATQMLAREVSSQIEARAAEARSVLLSASNAILEESRRHIEVQADLAISDMTQRVTSSLASLDAENRAACEARRRALVQDVAQAAEQSTEQFRKGIKAFLYSCLVAAVSAVDEHTQRTLQGLIKNPGKALHEIGALPGSAAEADIPATQDADPRSSDG